MPALRKRQKLDSCPVNSLPDSVLAQIFAYLPLRERFQLSAVSKQWRTASRTPWSDIKRLDLARIPSAAITPVLALCSSANEVSARDQTILLEASQGLPVLPQLHSLKLYDVQLSVEETGCASRLARKYKRLLTDYFGRFPNLEELVWHNGIGVDSNGRLIAGTQDTIDNQRISSDRGRIHLSATGTSLRRLQLTFDSAVGVDGENLLDAIARMERLECLYIGALAFYYSGEKERELWKRALGAMENLRELCLYNLDDVGPTLNAVAVMACEKLPVLEVLVFASMWLVERVEIGQLITSHPSLKILVVAVSVPVRLALDAEMDMTPVLLPRRLRQSPSDQRPLPRLHVFIGGTILHYLHFAVPQEGAAEFTEIDCPMPQFLAKPEVAEVFKDTWFAKMICEEAAHGVKPWGAPDYQDMDLFYSVNLLQFHSG